MDAHGRQGECAGLQVQGSRGLFQADVSQATTQALIRCHRDFGGLDILVNNAFSGRSRSVLDTSEEEWDALMAVTQGGLPGQQIRHSSDDQGWWRRDHQHFLRSV